MTLAAHKKFLVNVIEAEEDGVLNTVDGTLNVRKGDLILHNQLGEQSVVSKSYYNENYFQVQKVKKSSEFAKSYAQAASEFSLDSQFENPDYITKTKEISKVGNY